MQLKGNIHENPSRSHCTHRPHYRACCRPGRLVRRRTPPANAKPLSEIIKGVEEAGHKTIVELEFEDGVYEIEALDAQGKEVKLKVDPVSGKVNVK
ncbi:PepSY domain-containing protein [Pseudomonas aeruginosa]|uniref:PepSY domain-containing protein n=1 Tax=Pseudomonas aeruginosa TaxID=287 RepID=UPI003AF3986B